MYASRSPLDQATTERPATVVSSGDSDMVWRRRRFAAVVAFAGRDVRDAIEAHDELVREVCEFTRADRVLLWTLPKTEISSEGIIPTAEAVSALYPYPQFSSVTLSPAEAQNLLTPPMESLTAVRFSRVPPRCQPGTAPSNFLAVALGNPSGQAWVILLERLPQNRSWTDRDQHFLDDVSDILLLSLERNQLAANLVERTNYLNNILNFSDIGFLIIEHRSEGQIVSVANRRFCEFFNLDPVEIIEHPYENLRERLGTIIADWTNHKAQLDQIVADPSAELIDEIALVGTTPRVLNRFTTPARDARDRVFGRIFFFRDVTYDKQVETQLLHSQKMESIGTLAGGVAHDFNNLLTSMLGYTELLKRELADKPDLLLRLGNIEKGARRAAELTGNLLAFSRRKPTLLKVFDLNRLTSDTVTMIRSSIPASIEVRLKLAEGLPPIEADETQIQQVIMNLTLNARDAIKPDGHIVLSTRLGTDAQLGDESPAYVVMEVDDDGVGIPTDSLHRVFEPFYTTKEVGKGTGLGLSMVYGIIKKHQGFIEVHSAPGLGSRFSVYLPPSDKPIDITVPETPATICSEPKERSILIVDDEKDLCDFCELALSDIFARIHIAHDGQQAVEVFNQHLGEIDVVLLDLTMPRMPGGECFRRLKQIDPKCNVIITSGYSLDTDGQSLLDDGAMGFLSKPYNLDQLTRLMTEVLQKIG